LSENAFLKSARKKLVWLVVIIFGLAGIIGVGAATNQGASFAPKLALDLQGGTEIILSPLLEDGKDISEEQLAQAVSIIRQRVDATGVSEAQINTQGNGNIIVSIPGTPDENTLKLIRSSAKLEFRPVLAASASATATVGELLRLRLKASTARPKRPSMHLTAQVHSVHQVKLMTQLSL
jgi:preprotein translocase subunit SecD